MRRIVQARLGVITSSTLQNKVHADRGRFVSGGLAMVRMFDQTPKILSNLTLLLINKEVVLILKGMCVQGEEVVLQS